MIQIKLYYLQISNCNIVSVKKKWGFDCCQQLNIQSAVGVQLKYRRFDFPGHPFFEFIFCSLRILRRNTTTLTTMFYSSRFAVLSSTDINDRRRHSTVIPVLEYDLSI